MATRRAVVVDPNVTGRLAIREVEVPSLASSEALVRVSALSLNLGEVRRALTMAEAGWRPGWDIAGVVEKAAADGSGPKVGARVVGLVPTGGWSELVPVPTISLADIPASISFTQAATLPVAGLTALYALAQGGFLLGKSVLVTGASGGVGHFGCQLARHAGAHVVASVRSTERVSLVKEEGTHEVAIGTDLTAAAAFGPYDLILDSVGGRSLTNALTMLAQDGVCVLYGVSESPEVSFEARKFMTIGGASLYGLILFDEIKRRPASQGLTQLLRLVQDGRLRPAIEVEAPWTQVADVANRLYDRKIAGKAVLHIK
jgi:NADPH:quinone reductase-like Zn-dependent oxidoreductase